jgi:hypothetical protein
MSGHGDFPDEMPGYPFPRWRARDLDEPLLDALLARQPLPPEAPEQAHAAAAMLGSLAIPAGPGPLAGEAEARSAFAVAVSPAGMSSRHPVPRRTGRPRVRLRLLTAAVAVTTMLGGAAAAWAGVLPRPIQQLAHQVFGAPAASRPPHPSPISVLCSAYQQALMHGGPRARAAARAKLARAAGGAGKIGRYCATIPPGSGQPPPAARQDAGPGSKNNRGKANGHAKQQGHARKNAHASQKTHGQGRGNGHAQPNNQGNHDRP